MFADSQPPVNLEDVLAEWRKPQTAIVEFAEPRDYGILLCDASGSAAYQLELNRKKLLRQRDRVARFRQLHGKSGEDKTQNLVDMIGDLDIEFARNLNDNKQYQVVIDTYSQLAEVVVDLGINSLELLDTQTKLRLSEFLTVFVHAKLDGGRDFLSAVKYGTLAIELDPKNLPANYNTGMAYVGLGMPQKSSPLFRQAEGHFGNCVQMLNTGDFHAYGANVPNIRKFALPYFNKCGELARQFSQR